MNGWFPRVGVAGVASGNTETWLNGTLLSNGWGSPRWIDARTLMVVSWPDGMKIAAVDVQTGAVTAVTDLPCNVLRAGGGAWAVWSAVQGITFSDGERQPTAREPAVWGTHKAYLLDGQLSIQRLIVDNVEVRRAAIINLEASEQGLTWTEYMYGAPWTYGMRWSGTPQPLQASWDAEFTSCPIDHPAGPWVLSHDNSRLLLRPWGSRVGKVVAMGDTRNPHGAFDGANFRIAWCDGHGMLGEATVSPADCAEDLTASTVESFSTDLFDMMPYFLGDLNSWPHTGSHTFDCIVDSPNKLIYFVKGELRDSLEVFRFDDNAVYHYRDTNGGDEDVVKNGAAPVYHLVDAKWFDRRTRLGARVEVHTTLQRWNSDGSFQLDHPFAYAVTIARRFDNYPCGGDIGNAPVVVLKYDPNIANPCHGRYELFWLAYNWGCFKWQSVGAADNVLWKETTFTKKGGARVTPGDLVVPLHPGKKPAVHIVSPDVVEWDGASDVTLCAWDDGNDPRYSGKLEVLNGILHLTLKNPSGSNRSERERRIVIRG